MKKLVAVLAAALSASALFSGSNADAQVVFLPGGLSLGTAINVSCINPGSIQDVAKTPSLRNDTGKPIPAGKTLTWTASDGDSGSIKLTADLAPGASLKMQGKKPGNAYTCSGSFFTHPDLAPSQVQLASSTSVALTIQNRDAFVGAGASVARVQVYSCGGSLLQTVDAPAFALGAGESKAVSVAIKPVSGKVYVRVMADNGKQIAESNEQNNLLDTMNSCLK